MNFFAILFSSLAASSVAFHVSFPLRTQRLSGGFPTFRSTAGEAAAPYDTNDSAFDPKQDLMDIALSLNDEYGPLIIDSKAQERLRNAVQALENSTTPPASIADMVGEWTLLCSTASAENIKGIDTSKLPFFNADPVKEVRDRLNKSVKVQQVIKSDPSTVGIDRVDHVIQYMPPSELSEFVSNLPSFLQNLNINPLEVTNEKVILVHKAEVEGLIPFIKTKLTLESVVVNIAGRSQILDPSGADVFGVNVPFGDMLNAGDFDTTYMDDDLRISRSKVGVVDQLRVFTRSVPDLDQAEVAEASVVQVEDEIVEEVESAIEDLDEEIETPSDVEAESGSGASSGGEASDGDEGVDAPSDVNSED
eukprot:scaffold17809_cov115-Cylindrotheca_fusiformis.AAC.3